MEYFAKEVGNPAPLAPIQKLHLLVSENGKDVCRVELGIGAADALQNLFPPHVITGFQEQGFSFDEIEKKAGLFLSGSSPADAGLQEVAGSETRKVVLIDRILGQRRYEVWFG